MIRRGRKQLFFGAGDLYVTVYGGRTRLIGILLGRGLNIDEAQRELAGVTLESLVVARRVAKAVRILSENGAINKVCDIYRIEDGKLAEHWDVVEHNVQDIVPVHNNGLF